MTLDGNGRENYMATYVLVHGSYQGGWIWQDVAEPAARRRA